MRLAALRGAVALKDANDLAIIGKGFLSGEDARNAALHWRGALEKAFAKVNIGADFGDRATGGGGLGAEFQKQVEADLGTQVLWDVHGLLVFRCPPWPRFFGGRATASVTRSLDNVLATLATARRLGLTMSPSEQVAYALYSASLAESSPDARFMLLMMAVETLIELRPRPDASRAHVEKLIADTRAVELPKCEIDSMVGALQWMLDESFRRGGKRLASRLGDRSYMGKPAQKFFSDCYDLRGSLAHGTVPRPSPREVEDRAGALQAFTRDLLILDFPDEDV